MEETRRMTPSERAEHIWYYYKWYIIIGLLMTAFVIFCCVQCASREESDLKVLILTGETDTLMTEAACDEIRYFIRREYAVDNDGDGLASVEFYHYTVGDDVFATNATTQKAITLSIYGAEEFLILCDETGYRHLLGMGADGTADMLEPLDGLLNSDAEVLDGVRVCLDGTSLGELPTINETGHPQLYACLRSFTGSNVEHDRAAEARFKDAVRVLNAILADKAA